MAREEILPVVSVPFEYSADFGAYVFGVTALFELTVGETYTVIWDGEEYTRTAFAADGYSPGAVGIGNPAFVGGENDPEGLTFLIGYLPATNETAIITVKPGESHDIGIYKVEEEEPEYIILRTRDGTEEEYPMRPMIEIDKVGGGTVLYSEGVAVDGVVIEPDFRSGDMTVNAQDGYLVRSAVIAKPEDCEPENILKDKNIGGMVGTLVVPDQVLAEIDPDFSAGDMEVFPEEGMAFSVVRVKKPENLKPENIAKDEVVAGIVGTHEGSGGSDFDRTDPNESNFAYNIIPEEKKLVLAVMRTANFSDMVITIPDQIGGYDVVIDSEGVE